jgi:ABC-2 type transport system permease protein
MLLFHMPLNGLRREVYLAALVFIAANLIMGLLISTLVTATLAVVRFRRRLD